MVTTGANPTVVASEEDRVTGQLSKEKKKRRMEGETAQKLKITKI